jgi:hypothetical protein
VSRRARKKGPNQFRPARFDGERTSRSRRRFGGAGMPVNVSPFSRQNTATSGRLGTVSPGLRRSTSSTPPATATRCSPAWATGCIRAFPRSTGRWTSSPRGSSITHAGSTKGSARCSRRTPAALIFEHPCLPTSSRRLERAHAAFSRSELDDRGVRHCCRRVQVCQGARCSAWPAVRIHKLSRVDLHMPSEFDWRADIAIGPAYCREPIGTVRRCGATCLRR